MALNDEEKSGQQIRVIYKMNYSLDPTAASLSVIPVNDFCQNGYYSDWEEVKQQLIGLCFKERSKAPHNLHFQAIIRPLNYDLDVASREDYFTALKLAEMSGHPLDIMIKTPVVSTSGDKPNDIGAKASTSKTDDHKQKMERQSSVASNDSTNVLNAGFVLLNNSPNKTNTYSTQTDDKVVVMNEKQIEKIKKEITIDVTKRLISKLNECLSELTTSDSGSQGQDLMSDYLTGNGAEGGQPIPKVVHKGIICDNCDQQIEGIRYKCINCLDYDLCEPCKQKPVHYPNHTFNKIERYIPGIPKQTLPPSLDFLKPFLSGATIDPNTKDVVLTLDVDLTNGTICKSNVSQPSSANGSPKEANDDNAKPDEQQNGSSAKKNASDDESSQLLGPQVPQKRYCSDKRAKQITKKLEKLKHKSQLYTNLLQTSDDRSALSTHEKPKPMPIISNPSLVSNKTLYLSGLLIGDETIPEGTRMPPNTKFRKTWKVRNTGTKVWSGRTTLRFVWGHPELEPFGKVTEVQAPTLRPGEEGKVTIRFTSPNPSTVTRYQSYWRLHHRGQPFGPRLVVKIIVDPLATCITPSPTPLAPILSKDSRSAAIPMPAPKIPTRPPNIAHLYSVLDTNCNLEAVANIQQSIMDTQRNLTDRLQAMSVGKPTAAAATKEKTQKTSVKKLTEALSQVKELRFDLDDNETIPMKSNVKSHTTTPANTPFDISPPKSPEPTSSTNTFNQIESTEKVDKNEDKSEITNEKIVEHKADGNESDGESLDVLSLSSGGESSDEFVLVPFPSCFDLNVPFTVKDVNSNSDEDSPQNKSEMNCFEIVDNENNNETNEPSESDEDNTVQKEEVSAEQIRADHRLAAATLAAMAAHQQMQELFGQEMSRAEKHMETALDLTKEKQSVDNMSATQPQAEAQTPAEEQTSSESEPQVKPKTSSPSTNPFRNNPNETENVIHVLPESIVTGALSAAAHVYNNVSRALFSRHEGNNFAWVTSPPPAALPLPNMYWDNQGNPQYPSQPPYDGPPNFRPPHPSDAPTAPLMTPNLASQNPPPPPPAPSRLSSALNQLYEMGFWNQRLNQELLEKNDFDVNDTIEDLLSPDKNRHTRRGQSPPEPSEPVVSHQPTNRNGFIDEFD